MSIEAARLGGEQTFDRHVAALIKVFQEVAASRNSHGSHGRLGGIEAARSVPVREPAAR